LNYNYDNTDLLHVAAAQTGKSGNAAPVLFFLGGGDFLRPWMFFPNLFAPVARRMIE
jgi:hypothetical protein